MRRPGTVSGTAAVAAAAVAVVLVGVDAGSTLAGVAGLGVLGGGSLRRRQRAVTAGAALLGAATLLAGLASVDASALVAATATVVLAWTLGQTTVWLAGVDPEARTVSLELTHLAGTVAVVTAAAGVVVAPQALHVSPSPLGVALVLFGGVTLTATLLVDE